VPYMNRSFAQKLQIPPTAVGGLFKSDLFLILQRRFFSGGIKEAGLEQSSNCRWRDFYS
jgi:hypothetical protein